MRIGATASILRRGIVEWDITDLPDDADIQKVAILYQNFDYGASSASNDCCVRKLDIY